MPWTSALSSQRTPLLRLPARSLTLLAGFTIDFLSEFRWEYILYITCAQQLKNSVGKSRPNFGFKPQVSPKRHGVFCSIDDCAFFLRTWGYSWPCEFTGGPQAGRVETNSVPGRKRRSAIEPVSYDFIVAACFFRAGIPGNRRTAGFRNMLKKGS